MGKGNAKFAGTPLPAGTVPGSRFTTNDPTGIKVGLIVRVDEVFMTADVKVLTGGGDRYEIDLTQGMAGPRSFWGGVPEVNSIVLLGYRKVGRLTIAMILGYLPVGNRSGLRFDPFTAYDPTEMTPEESAEVLQRYGTTTRYKRLKIRPGQCGGMSADGAEFVLSRDVQMVNRAGDSFELRDADRTLVMQAIHKVESQSGVRTVAGPIRRSDMWLPWGITREGLTTLKDEAASYWGTDELQAAGPGVSPGGPAKFADSTGKLQGWLNDSVNQPHATYTNGKQAYYPTTYPGVGVEDPDGAGAQVYVEHRTEISHLTDMVQDVLGDIDGFTVDRHDPFIELVMGTLVGNDAFNSTIGQRNYGKILAPVLFEDFWQQTGKRLKLDAVNRSPTEPDLEVNTMAGAFLFRVRPPRKVNDNEFAVAVSKQGKLFVNVPGSSVERYPSGTKNVSAEMSFGGGSKIRMGMTAPEKLSLHLTTDGGLYFDLGADAQGNSLTVRHHGTVKFIHASTNDDNHTAMNWEIQGDKWEAVQGTVNATVEGSDLRTVSGQALLRADRVTTNAFSGYSLNAGEINTMVSGKSQYNHALAVLENIIAGGKVSTVLAGGRVTTTAAGAVADNVLGGAKTVNVAAGAYTVSVGTGAVSLVTGAGAVAVSTGAGAMSLNAAAGAVSVVAGLALNIVAATLCAITAPQILFGGPAAVLGVCRGIPMMPPGSPSLDWITGLPLQGSLVVRSW